MTATRRGVLIALAAGVVVAIFGLWLRVGPRSALGRPVPAPDADVTAVAAAYLDAAVRQDCAFTSALTERRTFRTFAWCTSPTMTGYHDVGAPILLPAAQAGVDQQCVEFEMTTTESADGSIRAGSLPWSLCFIKTPNGWRVHDQGHL